MKNLLVLLALTGISHGLLLFYSPEFVRDNRWSVALEMATWWGILHQWTKRQRKQIHSHNPNVVDLDHYRKSKKSPPTVPQWVCIYRSSDGSEVSLLSSLFEASQIPFQIGGRHSSSMFPNLNAMPMEFLVQPTDLEQARQLISDFSNLPQA